MRASVAAGVALLAISAVTSPAWAQVIDAEPDSGTADFGVGSRPINSVVANDTVNGAAAVLGSGGNATISRVGTWPSGIGLNTATAAVTTNTSVPVGVYSMQYQLCDLNTPPDCATTTVTVTVINASVTANPDTGTADAGVSSKPIANVTSNDSVDGGAVVLGASGNATVAKVGTWPAGIGLTPSTGAVSTGTGLGVGTYNVQYQLCDRNTPAQCATATITLNVINAAVSPNPDSGTAQAGIASKPIVSVVANDTIDGVPVVLGASGNGTIAALGTWPTGISLTPSTGAVNTTAAVAPGTYVAQYQLCDLNVPAVCNATNVTVTVTASIVAAPDAGWSVVGKLITVIPNVTANDTVNNAPAVLGPSGNATIATLGIWPLGLALDTTAGAVNITSFVAPGAYPLQYQLCDLYVPPDCATGTATVTISANYAENQATSTPMGDIEFDWGRDGINCPSCNFGDGNARANWTDRQGNIWIAHLDPTTGQFISPGANDEQVAPGMADAFFWNTYGNGPEWAFSTQGGQVVSQLVFTRYATSDPNPPTKQAPGYTGAAFATQTAYNTWTTQFFPGGFVPGSMTSDLPEASQCNSDPVATTLYKNFGSPLQMFLQPTAPGTSPLLMPFSSNGIGERFVPCTHQFTFQANAPYGSTTVQQVFWYNWDTGALEQVTTDATEKSSAFMFQAPDFGDNYILVTIAAHSSIQVYEQMGTNTDGSPIFTLVNNLTSPDPTEPYLNSSEPFIMCTPTCTTYAFMTVAKDNAQNSLSEPIGLAVAALSPNTPMFNILAPANGFPYRQREDPEYFITPNGAYLYYNQIIPQTGSSKYQNLGEYFIDMQLGTPSGACVGSSAEGGLMPGC